jgi:glycosyltransferase involved in cell wall biosynthesis
MRIGIDARLWNETGVGRYIRNLVWNLQELDKTNQYVLFVSKGLKAEDLGLKNEEWKVVETNIKWHTVEEQLQFPKILEKENLDLVHFPYFSIPIYYNRPFVLTIHDLIINHYPTGKSSTLPSPIYYLKLMGYKYVISQAAHKAKHIITVSHATKEEITDHLHVSEDKISVTYEGVEDSLKLQEPSGGSLGQNTKLPLKYQKYLLYVGNAYPHKNLDRLIDAFKIISKEFPDVELVLVGKEDYFYHRLQEKVKSLELEKQVIFTGFVSERELRQYYTKAIATIVPSLMEGFGLPGLEAMQEGCLVLASDIPSFREIYQKAAVYFDPLAVDSLHATIREVLAEQKMFHSSIEEGRKRVTFFSWEKMAEQTLKIYESSFGLRSD